MAISRSNLFALGSDGLKSIALGLEINSGQFGEVHALRGPHSGLAVKLYLDYATAALNDAKIGWMISLGTPLLGQYHKGKTYHQLAWPKEKVLDFRSRFSGFTMPEIDISNAVNLEWLIGDDNRRARNIPPHYSFRLHVAWNLATVFASLHKVGVCVIDVKPDNILCYRDFGYVCLLDCDSFIPTDKNQPAIGAGWTLGYILPEAVRSNNNYAPDEYREEQDKFALAVLIFRLMNEGVHPYQGRIIDSALTAQDLEPQSRIDAGLYPYGLVPNPRIKPALQSHHEWFDDTTRRLFDRAFNSRNRPSAKEWADHLAEYVGPQATKLYKCKTKPNEHEHFGKGCAACQAESYLRKLKARGKNKPKMVTGGVSPPVFPIGGVAPPLPPPPPPPPPPPATKPFSIWKIAGWGVGLLFMANVVSCISKLGGDISQPSPGYVTSAEPAGGAAVEPNAQEEPYVAPQYKTSFDCSGDLPYVEQTICGDASLAAKDKEMAELYAQALRSGSGSGVRDTQREWLKDRERCGGSGDIPACIHSEYDARIADLRRWQSPAPPVVRSTPQPSPQPRQFGSPAEPRQGFEQPPERPIQERVRSTREVQCILPSGEEVRLSFERCRERAGVIYQ